MLRANEEQARRAAHGAMEYDELGTRPAWIDVADDSDYGSEESEGMGQLEDVLLRLESQLEETKHVEHLSLRAGGMGGGMGGMGDIESGMGSGMGSMGDMSATI